LQNYLSMLSKRKKINHLYCRAGFGVSIEVLDFKSKLTLESIVDELIQGGKNSEGLAISLPVYEQASKLDKAQKAGLKKKLKEENGAVNIKWVEKMVASKNPLVERM